MPLPNGLDSDMRINWEDLFGKGREGRTIPVKSVRASRARYVTPDIQRCELEIELEGGERIILDMNVEQVAKAVHELINVHDAIHPPLRPRMGGTWS